MLPLFLHRMVKVRIVNLRYRISGSFKKFLEFGYNLLMKKLNGIMSMCGLLLPDADHFVKMILELLPLAGILQLCLSALDPLCKIAGSDSTVLMIRHVDLSDCS